MQRTAFGDAYRCAVHLCPGLIAVPAIGEDPRAKASIRGKHNEHRAGACEAAEVAHIWQVRHKQRVHPIGAHTLGKPLPAETFQHPSILAVAVEDRGLDSKMDGMEQTLRDRVRKLPRPSRREFITGAGAVAAAALVLDATLIDRHYVVVEQRTLRIQRLPAPFHGLRIAQISDLHHRGYAEDYYLRHVVEKVNALQPTAVAITGDFITAHGSPLGPWRTAMPVCAEILSGLQAPVRLCSLGNHDCIDVAFVMRGLAERGLTVLYNSYTALESGGERLWIGGLADAYFDSPSLELAVPPATEREPVLLLGHEPDYADTVKLFGGVDVMLAGHSHGGQVRLPSITQAFLPVMGRKYVQGLYQVDGMQLYVNRGIGAVHLPVRFRCPPEITLFTLQPET